MRIVIAGAGQIGSHLAKLLFKDGHDVTLIDEQQQRLNSVSSCVDLLTLCGSPGSISLLKEANVKGADLFIGVTPDESRNIPKCSPPPKSITSSFARGHASGGKCAAESSCFLPSKCGAA